jgi:hypothetical protein
MSENSKQQLREVQKKITQLIATDKELTQGEAFLLNSAGECIEVAVSHGDPDGEVPRVN